MDYKLIEIIYGKRFLMFSEYSKPAVGKCPQIKNIAGPEDMSEDLEDSSMQCKLVENREDYSETYKDLCRQYSCIHEKIQGSTQFQGLHGGGVLCMFRAEIRGEILEFKKLQATMGSSRKVSKV